MGACRGDSIIPFGSANFYVGINLVLDEEMLQQIATALSPLISKGRLGGHEGMRIMFKGGQAFIDWKMEGDSPTVTWKINEVQPSAPPHTGGDGGALLSLLLISAGLAFARPTLADEEIHPLQEQVAVAETRVYDLNEPMNGPAGTNDEQDTTVGFSPASSRFLRSPFSPVIRSARGFPFYLRVRG